MNELAASPACVASYVQQAQRDFWSERLSSGVERSDKSKKVKASSYRLTFGSCCLLCEEGYFLGAITSFTALATRNFTTVLAAILMGSPVCGLRPIRAFRLDFTRRPRPGITNTPFFLVSLIAVSARCSRNAAAVLLFVSSFSAMWRTSWVLVMPAAIFPP